MAQGSRGRVALLGAGVLFCTGLVGCQDTKPYPPPPLAKGSGPSMNGMTRTPGTTTGTGMTPGGSGAATTRWNEPTGRTVPTGNNFPTAPGMGNFAPISGQTVPGNYGAGAPIPGANPIVPSVSPTPSNYTPTYPNSSLTPGSHSNPVVADTTARGAAPVAATPTSYPVPEMADPYPQPPPAPSTPAVAPPSAGPIAPPSPPPGSGPLPPQYPIK